MSEVAYKSNLPDADLVARSIEGQKDAFSELVNRHKSAACGVAYSICGDMGLSEDVAQDAFVSAWGQLMDVRDRSSFRSWICGIARNLALNLVRKRSRRGEGVSINEETAVDEAMAPDEAAISADQLELLWNSIHKLPDNYREPLVLFYRENQSVASVATALDLSEENVRQRLSRGRSMLREGLTKHIEDALTKTRPGMVFTMGVMSALPPVAVGLGVAASATSAKAATTGSVGAAKTGGALLGGGLISTMVSGAVGFFGFYLLYKYLKALKLPKGVRQLWLRAFSLEVFVSVVFSGFVVWFAYTGGYPWGPSGINPTILAGTAVTAFMAAVFLISWKAKKRSKEVFGEEGSQLVLPRRYQSKLRLAGLPLIAFAQGSDPVRDEKWGVAKGWIAVGDCAIGLIAVGGVAVGPFSLGGFSLGLLAVGGNAIGLWGLGGVVAGIYAVGGIALGWEAAVGGMAIAHDTAMGGLAVASEQAMGGVPVAPVVLDYAAVAEQFAWFKWLTEMGPNVGWLFLLLVPVMIYASRLIDRAVAKSEQSK